MRAKLVMVLVATLAVLGCAEGPSLRERVLATPARRLSSYPATLRLPLRERVGEIPPVFLEHLRAMDRNDSYAPFTPSAEQRALVARYLELLPPANRRVLESRLVGLYFVSGLVGTGLCEYLLDDVGGVYVVMAFNPDCLTVDLGQWLTRRERSTFEGTEASVVVDCGEGPMGFLYGILHESTHALDYVKPVTPFVEPVFRALDLPGPEREPVFTTTVWRGYAAPLSRHDSPLRRSIGFYGLGSKQLRASDAPRVYEWLDRSPFVSLYGSLSWAEDLAECVTWYHYVAVLGGSYTVTYTDAQGVARTLGPAMKVRERPGWTAVLEAVYGR